jgi:hypothetical protein
MAVKLLNVTPEIFDEVESCDLHFKTTPINCYVHILQACTAVSSDGQIVV